MSEALRLADEFDKGEWIATTSQWREEAAAELRRLHDLHGKANALCRIRAERIKELEAELIEQARVNGMGSEREARLMAVNAELVEALQQIANVNAMDHEYQQWARAALANGKVNLEEKAK